MREIGPGMRDYDNDWMREAACVSLPDLPWTRSQPHPRAAAAMNEVCASCPVRAECLDYAIATDVTAGWWAGRSFNNYTCHKPPRRDPALRAARGDVA